MIKNYTLTRASIDEAAEDVMTFCEPLRITKQDALRYRLSVEEVLGCWLDRAIGDTFTIKCEKRLGKPSITVSAAGEKANPYENSEDEWTFINNLRVALSNGPTYRYRSGQNAVTFPIKLKQMNTLVHLAIVIAAAIAVGLFLLHVVPDNITAHLMEEFIDPLYTSLFRVLGCISGPLILLSVMWGIYGIGDAETLGKVGKRLIFTFTGGIFLIAVSSLLTYPIFNPTFVKQTEGKSVFGVIFEMILDILPPNIIEPLASGNTLQIIFLAVVFGIALLFLGKRVQALAEMIDQINSIIQFLMGLISHLIPTLVFLIVIRLIVGNTFSLLHGMWKLIAVFLAAGLLMCAIITIWTAVAQRVSPRLLFKKSLPPVMIALTTASSSACFSSNLEVCEKKFGINRSLTGVGIPIGMVIFKSSLTIYHVLLTLFFAKQTGVECSVSWLVTAVFLSAMLAIATPPIAGGGVVAFTVLFTRLGISTDALAIALSFDILCDFVRTAMNIYTLPPVLVNIAARLDLLDRDVLRKDE